MRGRHPRLPPFAEVERVWLVAGAGFGAGLVAAYAATPALRPWLREEGGLTEALTPAVLALAVLLGVWSVRTSLRPERITWLVPGFALLALLDEVRYGADVLPGRGPTVAGEEIAGITDLVDVVLTKIGTWGVPPAAVVAAVIALAAGAAVAGSLGSAGRERIGWVAARPWAARLAAAAALLAVATLFDLLGGPHARFAEEAAELGAAFTAVLAALAVPRSSMPLQRWRVRLQPWLDDPAVPAAGRR
ncbi:MAG: hypothetical protein R3290_07645 [Acidimicrobiia bacterium]|nr:hypothetical protein [Acidimicrobiia bacterium]